MQILKQSWSLIFIDFIVKLSLSKELMIKFKYNFIMVVVDRLTKNIKFISFIEQADARDLAYVFLK